ncbi:MAG: hypothetical protein Ct9H300mP6_09530 [Gammaproteobacteria bacterium]|nr:MAG: hypothetical protein Ct9H300mP6_09530 [Gammaproteobacteria bacterium]
MKKISLEKLLNGSDSKNQSDESKRLKDAMTEDCYFLLVDHGVSEQIIDDAYEQSRIFHNLDDSDLKKQAAHYRHAHSGRGWSPCGEEPATQQTQKLPARPLICVMRLKKSMKNLKTSVQIYGRPRCQILKMRSINII